MKNSKQLTSFESIKVYSDPFRMMILKTYFKMNRAATVKQIADTMGEVPAKIHYHVKKMVECGILKLSYTKDINGITAKFYEPVAKSFIIQSDEIRQDEQIYLNSHKGHLDLFEVFDDHKLSAITAMNESKSQPFVMASNLHLTPQEYKDLTSYIERLHLRSQRKSGKKKTYRFLTTISTVNDTKDDLDVIKQTI